MLISPLVQRLPRLRDLEVIFGHELSDKGILHLALMKSIQRLKLLNFVRLHDSNIDLLTRLPSLEELIIQVSFPLGFLWISRFKGCSKTLARVELH